MNRKFKYLIIATIVLTGCSTYYSSSFQNNGVKIGSAWQDSSTILDGAEDDMRSVVLRYIEIARTGKYEGIESLISLPPKITNERPAHSQDPNSDSPDPAVFEKLGYDLLAKSIPTTLFRGQFQVEKIITKKNGLNIGVVTVFLRSSKYPDDQLMILDFWLAKNGKRWRAYRVEFSAVGE